VAAGAGDVAAAAALAACLEEAAAACPVPFEVSLAAGLVATVFS
jgi:hypothetical protein